MQWPWVILGSHCLATCLLLVECSMWTTGVTHTGVQRLIWTTKKDAWNRTQMIAIMTVNSFQIPCGRNRK